MNLFRWLISRLGRTFWNMYNSYMYLLLILYTCHYNKRLWLLLLCIHITGLKPGTFILTAWILYQLSYNIRFYTFSDMYCKLTNEIHHNNLTISFWIFLWYFLKEKIAAWLQWLWYIKYIYIHTSQWLMAMTILGSYHGSRPKQ